MKRRTSPGAIVGSASRTAPTSEPRYASGTVRVVPATVLIADDDEDTRTALREILVAGGSRVIEAADGTRALEILALAADGRAPLPDLVLLDFVMPGLSGLGILGVMRRFPRMPPTILMTGFPDPSVETFARALGVVRVLRKPIDEEALSRAILEALRQPTRAD